MKFKIIIIIGIFLLLISSLSIANPISQTETPAQKTEQTHKKKPNFIQKIILKKIERKIKHDGEQASSLSQTSMWLGIASFPLIFLYGMGLILALAAIITGIIAFRQKDNNKKSRSFAIAGIALGATLIVSVLLIVGAYFYFITRVGWI